MRRISLFFGLFCLFFLTDFLPVASAQLLLETGKVTLSLAPGETAVGEIKINNMTDKDVAVKTYWQDFSYTPPFDGNKKFFAPTTTPYSCTSWTSFSPQSFALKPFEKKTISYNIKFPSDASGGYYGVLFFENTSAEKDAKTGVSVIARVGCLFFLETAGSPKDASISDVAAVANRIEGEIKNKSQLILIPKGIFYIMNKDGMIADRGEVDTFYLPPGQDVPFFINISNKISAGVYTLVVTFDLGDGASLVKEIDFERQGSGLTILQARD